MDTQVTPVRGKRGALVHLCTYGVGRDKAPEDLPVVLCGVRISQPIVEPDSEVTCWKCENLQYEIETFN